MAPGTCSGGARPGMGTTGNEISDRPTDTVVQAGGDQLHMNDASYHCIARLLADSLTSAALATPRQVAD